MKNARTLSIFTLLFILYANQSWGLKPLPAYIATPANYGINYKEIDVDKDGVKIKSWFCQHKERGNNNTIILCNGDFGNMSYWLTVTDSLYKRGFDVILFDYRGFGQSSPASLDSNALIYDGFWKDFSNVYQYYKKEYNLSRINVLAYSMGTMAVTMANKINPKLITGQIVFDSYIYSLSHTIEILKSKKNRPFYANINEEAYSSAQKSMFNLKVLNFQGTQDDVGNPTNYDWSQVKKWDVVRFNGGHMRAMQAYVNESGELLYFHRITEFLNPAGRVLNN